MRADDRTIRVESPCCGLLYGAARASPSGVDCTRVTGAHVSDASDRQCTVGPSSGPRCAVCAGPNSTLAHATKRNSRPKRKGHLASRSGFGQGARRPRKRTHRPHTPHPVVARRGPERPQSVRPAGPAGRPPAPGQRQRQHAHTTAWLFSDTLGRRGDITLSTGFPFRLLYRATTVPFRLRPVSGISSTDSYGVARWSVNDDLMIRWNRVNETSRPPPLATILTFSAASSPG